MKFKKNLTKKGVFITYWLESQMSIDSAFKKLKKIYEQSEKFKSSGKIELWNRLYSGEITNFTREWFTLLKFSDNQEELFISLCDENMKRLSKKLISLEEWLEIVYNSTIQTLILIPNKRN